MIKDSYGTVQHLSELKCGCIASLSERIWKFQESSFERWTFDCAQFVKRDQKYSVYQPLITASNVNKKQVEGKGIKLMMDKNFKFPTKK